MAVGGPSLPLLPHSPTPPCMPATPPALAMPHGHHTLRPTCGPPSESCSSSLETLRDRGEAADEEDERGVAELLLDQIEFADVILLNKVGWCAGSGLGSEGRRGTATPGLPCVPRAARAALSWWSCCLHLSMPCPVPRPHYRRWTWCLRMSSAACWACCAPSTRAPTSSPPPTPACRSPASSTPAASRLSRRSRTRAGCRCVGVLEGWPAAVL